MGDLLRSIPSIMDGLTPTQRKILLCVFRKPISGGVTLGRLCDYVAPFAYPQPHGEQGLVSATLCMMKNNNINLFYPIEQFGTQQTGVKRIKVRLSPITRHIFLKADEPLLNYLNEYGKSRELAWFIPIIPMVLVNGSVLIRKDFTSFVPRFNPKDIIANLKRLLNDEAMVSMNPWYIWFKLTYNEAVSEGYMDHDMTAEKLSERVLSKTLKLCTKDMNLLDSNGAMKKYDTPEQILKDFFHIRLEFYDKRKLALCHEIEFSLLLLDNKVRFIRETVEGTISVKNRSIENLCSELKDKGYTASPATTLIMEYDYLLTTPILFSLPQLLSERDLMEAELEEMKNTSPKSLWLRDLDVLEKQLDEKEKRNEDDDDDDDDDDDRAEII